MAFYLTLIHNFRSNKFIALYITRVMDILSPSQDSGIWYYHWLVYPFPGGRAEWIEAIHLLVYLEHVRIY